MKEQLSDGLLLKAGAYIDGGWVSADDGTTLPVVNPSSGSVIAEVARCGTNETRRIEDIDAPPRSESYHQ